MKILKDRKTQLISKRKLTVAINLFEKYVDEPIESIIIHNYLDSIYVFKTDNTNYIYHVNIAKNKVEKIYNKDWLDN